VFVSVFVAIVSCPSAGKSGLVGGALLLALDRSEC
jgi:hypothetical protein